ncbi:MAG: phosphatidylinositol-specific phospholipase C1-like protein [Segetibacter sp.]
MKMILLLLFFIPASFVVPGNELNNLRLNEIQVIGSHNSYKQSIDPALFKFLSKTDSASLSKIDYSHISLTRQLDAGLLNLEIDVYADPKGGKYSHPKGLDMVKEQPPFDPEGVMKDPGFKVFHIPDIDYRSSCLTFKECLEELKAWSEKHPDHYPVFITMNAKDEGLKKEWATVPQKFTSATFDSLDHEITTYLGKENLITPEMVKGKYATLRSAVLHHNWPLIKNVKGKFLFVLDETGDKTTTYTKGHPSLQGRILFTNSKPDAPEAAIMIMNNSKKDSIQSMVKKGYIVRTRADSDTKEARNNDRSSFEAACKSGAQIITTDYYQKSTHFYSNYIISFEGNKYIRVDPVFNHSIMK